MQNPITPRLYSVRSYGEVYDCGKTKIYELIHQGKLVAIKVGKNTRITAESAEALVATAERLPTKSGEAA